MKTLGIRNYNCKNEELSVICRYALAAAGFDRAITEQLSNAVSSITADNQLQFDIVNKRKAAVQKNLKTLNDLYSQLTDLLSIGKSLYKNVNPQKSKEYAFEALKKSVRNTKRQQPDTSK
jgi:signal transduction protein with GAF and PtsI domain